MNIWEFMADSPFIGFIMVCAVYYTVKHLTYTLPSRYIRSKTVQKAGWPPEHLDANGDFKPEKDIDPAA